MWVVLVHNSELKVTVVGTPEGRPFRTEASAIKTAKRIEREHPVLRTLVSEIAEGW